MFNRDYSVGKYFFLSARKRNELRERESPRSLSPIYPYLLLQREIREENTPRARDTKNKKTRAKKTNKRLPTSDFNSGSGFSAAAVAEDGLLAALLLSAATTLLMLLLMDDDDFCANCLLDDKDLVFVEDAMRALDEDEQAAVLDMVCVVLFVFFERFELPLCAFESCESEEGMLREEGSALGNETRSFFCKP